MNSKPRALSVKLISAPQNPLGTLFYVWEQSRTNDPVPDPSQIEAILKYDGAQWVEFGDPLYQECVMLKGPTNSKPVTTQRHYDDVFLVAQIEPGQAVDIWQTRSRLRSVIDQIFDEDIPCTENLTFVFALENMPISLREQMVRHRIGVTIGDRTGADIVPDLQKSTWWSQTTRMLPMGQFYQDGRYVVPDSLAGKALVGPEGGVEAETVYLKLLEQIEWTYNKLVEAGVPMEDARQIIPVAVTHGITWGVNLKALMHIVGKRACWVAQVNLWADLIAGMVDELAVIDPIFRRIILPPCFKKGSYNACPYFQINRERVQGRDNMPPCPLYVYNETKLALQASRLSVEDTGIEATWTPPVAHFNPAVGQRFSEAQRNITDWDSSKPAEKVMLEDNIGRFERLWKLNVFTGEPVGARS